MQWALMTILDPPSSLANLIYIGYGGDPAKALRVTRRRLADRKKQKTERNVFQCFVFGPKKAGKSALLNTLIRRSHSCTDHSFVMISLIPLLNQLYPATFRISSLLSSSNCFLLAGLFQKIIAQQLKIVTL